MASFSSLRYGKSNSLNSPVLLKNVSRKQKLRSGALGWDGWIKESFETNQSLMNNFKYGSNEEEIKINAFAENGLSKTCLEGDQSLKHSAHCLPSKETSFLCDSFSMGGPNLTNSVLFELSSFSHSTNKAIFTILLPSTQILVVNSAACQLINYNIDELCSLRLENLIHECHKHKLKTLQDDLFRDSSHNSCNNGKLLEFVRKDGDTVTAFVYLKKIDNPQRCLAIAEPFDRKEAFVSVDESGKILSYDEEAALMFQYDPSELVGVKIHSLLPSLSFVKYDEHHSKKSLKQKITGRTKNGEAFPVCLTVSSSPSSEIYRVMILMYINLNGLILLNKGLLITNFNHYFVKLLFGYSKKEIFNQHITKLIPRFCKDIGFDKNKKVQYPNEISSLINDTSFGGCHEKNDITFDSNPSWSSKNEDSLKSLKSSSSFNSCSDSLKVFGDSCSELKLDSKCSSKTFFRLQNKELENNCCDEEPNGYFMEEKLNSGSQFSSEIKSNDKGNEFDLTHEDVLVQEGRFLSFALHSDGSHIDIKYQVKIVNINEEIFYCISLARDLQKFQDISAGLNPNATMASSFNSTSFDGSLPKDSVCSEQCTRPSTASIISQCDENLTAGEYSQYYTNIKQIGEGGFGYVKMAFRNSDGLLVVTKFIEKKKINVRFWVFDSNLNMKIPLEISLLRSLQHPNIVRVLDVFHNESYVQLVMEKHGAGFDLFKFIGRGPKCDEKLKSYIFRQIISAVHYLNSLGILHRDIKDENVIINEKFEVKLIDFGSATFMPPNETFSKFYGTFEFCSPEVLQGNAYRGPELEIWALGVTLYVLTFGENPFYNIEETIKGYFAIPTPISIELNDLLHKMLDKNVETRITIDQVVEDLWINQPVSIENYKFEEVVRCYEKEAYPPKYVYEINSEELYSKEDSDQLLDTNNSNSSLQNIPTDELGDLDENFQEIHKVSKLDLEGEKLNISQVVLSSTPVHKESDRFCKSSVGLRKHFENSLTVSDQSCNHHRHNSVENELSYNESVFSCFKNDSSNSTKPDNLKDEINIPVLSDNSQLDLKMYFKKSPLFEDRDSSREDLSENECRLMLRQDDSDDAQTQDF